MLCFSMEVIWRGGINIKDIFKPKCTVCGLWLWNVHRTGHFQLLLKKTAGALYSFQVSCNNQEWADLWEKGCICSCHLIPCIIRKGRICAKQITSPFFFYGKGSVQTDYHCCFWEAANKRQTSVTLFSCEYEDFMQQSETSHNTAARIRDSSLINLSQVLANSSHGLPDHSGSP